MDNFALDNTKEELGVGDAVLVTETVDGEVVVRKVGYAFKMVPLKTLCSVGTISKSLLLCRSLWYTKSKIHRKHEINLHWNQVFNNFIFYHLDYVVSSRYFLPFISGVKKGPTNTLAVRIPIIVRHVIKPVQIAQYFSLSFLRLFPTLFSSSDSCDSIQFLYMDIWLIDILQCLYWYVLK